jgi:hypothetical protein
MTEVKRNGLRWYNVAPINGASFIMAVLLVSFGFVHAAIARPLNERDCLRAATDVYLDAVDKGAGKSLADQIKEVDVGIPRCQKLFGDKCLYRDAEDVKRVYDFLAWLYSPASEGMTANHIANEYLDACKAAVAAPRRPGFTDGPAMEYNGPLNTDKKRNT